MKLEQNDKQLLFSETQVPDIFFTDYLPELPGDYLKIYLYLVFLSKYKKDVKINLSASDGNVDKKPQKPWFYRAFCREDSCVFF